MLSASAKSMSRIIATMPLGRVRPKQVCGRICAYTGPQEVKAISVSHRNSGLGQTIPRSVSSTVANHRARPPFKSFSYYGTERAADSLTPAFSITLWCLAKDRDEYNCVQVWTVCSYFSRPMPRGTRNARRWNLGRCMTFPQRHELFKDLTRVLLLSSESSSRHEMK